MSSPRDLNGSSSSVDQGPSSRRGLPGSLTLESLDERLGHVERHVEDLTAAESSLPEELLNIRRVASAQAGLIEEMGKLVKEGVEQSKANGIAIAKLTEVVGESPDLSTGKPGTGMRKQLSDLVTKAQVPAFVAWLTPAMGTAYGLYQALKFFGVFH